MGAEDVWRRKSDFELQAAAERLEEYNEGGQRAIRAELDRRRSPEYLLEQEAAIETAAATRREASRVAASSAPPDTNKTLWMARRILIAMCLMIGFYVFALTITFVLLWIPYAELTYAGRLHFQLAAVCIGAGLTILWALVPRRDRFDAPGPRLDESKHPRLFTIIQEVATATDQERPADVYLLNEVNAWVTHRGGMMGFGSRRVMGVGLPLLQALSVPEFKAIVAHEFGHYSSGDVKLGPWVYKTRAAIARTIAGVHRTFVEEPFLWYGRQFMKLTHAVSRQQEFIADRVAAQVVGGPIVASALRRVTVLTPLYSSYLNDEVLPVMRAGFLPPVAAGFDQFLETGRIAEVSQRILEAAEEQGHTDLFDTHPSLRDRLSALDAGPDPSTPLDRGQLAAVLIGDPNKHGLALLEFALGREKLGALRPIEWPLVGESVYAKSWRETASLHSRWLGRFTADALPAGKHAFIRLGSDLVSADESNVNSEERIARAVSVLAISLGALLLDDGWQVRTGPGLPIVLARGSRTFDPFAAIRALADNTTTLESWKAECDVIGIAGRRLGTAVVTKGASGVSAVHAATPQPTTPPVMRSQAIEQVNCWRCKSALPLDEHSRGKTVKCSQCGTKQQLPR